MRRIAVKKHNYCKVQNISTTFLVIVQLDAQILFNVFIFIYSSLHVSSLSCSSSGETDCINIAVLIQSVSPDDEHDVLDTCREL